jgi:hypothetical protein
MKARVIIGVVVVGVLALAVLGITSGVSQIVTRTSGERSTARVSDCIRSGGYKTRSLTCTGTWITGGRLVGGDGHVVVGKVEGANPDDVGHTIAVRLSDDGQHAYTPSLVTPIVYLVIGVAFAALGLYVLVAVFIRRRPPAGAAGAGDSLTSGVRPA